MPDFFLVDRAVITPGRCAYCSRHDGPMVDTLVEHRGYGRQYACATCVDDLTRARGGLTPAQAASAAHDRQLLENRVAELEAEVQAALDSRVVSLQDVKRMVLAGQQAQAGASAPVVVPPRRRGKTDDPGVLPGVPGS